MENQSIGVKLIQLGTTGQGAYLKHRGDPAGGQARFDSAQVLRPG